jgi:hypothetical protein
MPDLRRELELMAAEVDWPATPVLDVRVDMAAPAPRRVPRGLRLALVALLVLLLATATALAASRSVREFFGLAGVTVEPTALDPPELRPQPLSLGRRASLAEARRVVPVVVPRALGQPDDVYVGAGEVSLAYGPRPGLPRARQLGFGLLVTEVRGSIDAPALGKLLPAATRVQRLRVGPHAAIWIEGAPHFFAYRGPNGEFREGSLRAAGNVLLLQRGGLLVRLEGAFGRERAVEVAASLD